MEIAQNRWLSLYVTIDVVSKIQWLTNIVLSPYGTSHFGKKIIEYAEPLFPGINLVLG